MKESATLMMSKKARILRSKGIDVINLSLGEPDFDTPQHVIDAAKEGLDKGYTRYTPVNGLLELRVAICSKFERDNDLHYSPEQIVVSTGAKQSIANVFLAILDPGDEVIVLSPYWVSYYPMIKASRGVPVAVEAGVEDDFKPPVQQIKDAITSKTKALIFSTPCNPTGAVWNRNELMSMRNMLQEFPDILVICDEIYEFINFLDHHVSIGSLPDMQDRCVTVNGFSKGFAMTGWRIGYIGAPLEIAAACTKIQGQYTSGANAFGQYAGSVALNSSYDPSFKMRQAYIERKKLVLDRASEIPEFICSSPQGAFYIFPDVSATFGKSYNDYEINSGSDLAMYLLEKAHVAVVTGEAFGSPNCIRISFAASDDDINAAFDSMKKWIGLLN